MVHSSFKTTKPNRVSFCGIIFACSNVADMILKTLLHPAYSLNVPLINNNVFQAPKQASESQIGIKLKKHSMNLLVL